MHITVLTLFPDMFQGPLTESIVKRAQNQKIITVTFVNIRNFAADKHKSVDDHPFGGGAGMILRVDVVDKALRYAKSLHVKAKAHSILLDTQGTPYDQKKAKQ